MTISNSSSESSCSRSSEESPSLATRRRFLRRLLDMCRWRVPFLGRARVRVDEGMTSSTLTLPLAVSAHRRVLPLPVVATFGFTELGVNAAANAWSRGVGILLASVLPQLFSNAPCSACTRPLELELSPARAFPLAAAAVWGSCMRSRSAYSLTCARRAGATV
jgi:hypothetical protein